MGVTPRTLHHRDRVGMAAHIVLAGEVGRVTLTIDQPVFIMVRHGTKTLRCNGREWTLHAGDVIALAGGHLWEITNQLGPEGRYEAWWLRCDAALVAAHAASSAAVGMRVVAHAWPLKPMVQDCRTAFDRALAAIDPANELPEDLARHHVGEALLWLAQFGACFGAPTIGSLTQQLRQRISRMPGADWSTGAVCQSMALSEATLRRRLANEGTSLRTLLVDVRMSYALTMLQATERPVAVIAHDVGYESPSRFALRFRQHFGFAPTALRGHHRHVSAKS